MITEFKNFTFESNYYDFTKSNEDWIRKNIEKFRYIAKEFLVKKQRVKYYSFIGEGYVDGYCVIQKDKVCYSYPFTDDELQRLRTQWIDAYNKDNEEPIPYDEDINFKELYDACPINEINDEIREWIEDMTSDNFIEIQDISPTHHYRYSFDVSFYDKETQSFLDPIELCIELSDEEYIQLLTERLLVPDQFCYNRIVLTLPQIARRITEYVHDWCFYHSPIGDLSKCPPFVVHFTEIEEDAKQFDKK